MLKEKLPAILPSHIDIENLLFSDVIASSITSNKGTIEPAIISFIESRRTLTQMLNAEAFRIIADNSVMPMFMTQKQKDLLLSFISSQIGNLNFLDFDLQILSNTHFSKVDMFAQHKKTQAYFLFAFTYFDMFSFTGQFFKDLSNTESNIENLGLNIARVSIKKRAGLDVTNMAIINFSPSQKDFSVLKCAVIDDAIVQSYVDAKEKPTVVLGGSSNNKGDIFGNGF